LRSQRPAKKKVFVISPVGGKNGGERETCRPRGGGSLLFEMLYGHRSGGGFRGERRNERKTQGALIIKKGIKRGMTNNREKKEGPFFRWRSFFSATGKNEKRKRWGSSHSFGGRKGKAFGVRGGSIVHVDILYKGQMESQKKRGGRGPDTEGKKREDLAPIVRRKVFVASPGKKGN